MFTHELEKLAKEKQQAFKDALIFGIPPTIAAIILSHPLEHSLYGKQKGWATKAKTRYFPHLGLRVIKGTLAGGGALVGAKYIDIKRKST